MAFGSSTTKSGEIKKPKCAACGIDMWLMRMEPRLDCDMATFECARCDAFETREIAPGQNRLLERSRTSA